jgi:hypothetical protein
MVAAEVLAGRLAEAYDEVLAGRLAEASGVQCDDANFCSFLLNEGNMPRGCGVQRYMLFGCIG